MLGQAAVAGVLTPPRAHPALAHSAQPLASFSMQTAVTQAEGRSDLVPTKASDKIFVNSTGRRIRLLVVQLCPRDEFRAGNLIAQMCETGTHFCADTRAGTDTSQEHSR